MFGWKKYRFRVQSSSIGTQFIYIQTIDGVDIAPLGYLLNEYIPELSKLKPNETTEIEIRIKGRK